MVKVKSIWPVISGLIVISLVVASCAPKPAAQPAPPVPPPPPAPVSEGKTLYSQKCAACHGPNAEGTAVGPMIAGHSMAAIKMQVRNPMGKMMAFPTSQLSDKDLDEIAEFVARMGPAKAPVQDWEKAAPETMHYWMALLAIQNNDMADARHHLQDALAYVKDPARQTEMNMALDMISKGNMHDAEHEIEEMAGSESPSGITRQRLHLVLAMSANEAKDATRVKHHLEHFMVKATDSQKKIAQEALELIEKKDFHEAEHEIEELMK